MTHVASVDRRPRPANGFSTIELVLTMGIILVVTTIALPSFINAYRMYQLSDAASQVAGVLEATRLDAIRRNTFVNCIIQQAAGPPPVTRMWTDSIPNTTEDPQEKQILFAGAVNLVDSGSVPGTGNLAAAVGVTGFTAVTLGNASIGFDQRGAGNPNSVYALYVTNTNAPDAGYRALILLPSGTVQTWQADAAGNWRFLK